MTPSGISRRYFLLGGAALPFLGAVTAGAQSIGSGDHGIGGSGFSIQNSGGDEDHGIGGTGIVGTIQGFGSIIVNDVHIPFGTTTPVSIDGRRVPTSAMKVGHVVRVLLAGTRAQIIAIVSEVQGRIDQIDRTGMTILSQDIDTTELKNHEMKGLRRGARVAVFGIRKPDGTIIARRIERRMASDGAHVRGVPRKTAAGIQIGGLMLGRETRHLVGKQTLVRIKAEGGRQIVGRVEAEAVVPGLRHGVINVETYGRHGRGSVDLGLGISAPVNRMRLSPDGHGYVDLSIRDSSRMTGATNGRGPDNGGPPPPQGPRRGPPPDRSTFGSSRPGEGQSPSDMAPDRGGPRPDFGRPPGPRGQGPQ
jgi:hypothetical protein